MIAETKVRSRNNAVAREALKRNGVVIVAGSVEEARAITNRLAPEHLTVDAASDLKWVENAGSVFVGRWSAQPMGDYISGPNHTLPTGGMARVRGGLSVNDFVKLITVQEYRRRASQHWDRKLRCWLKPKGCSATPRRFERGSARPLAKGGRNVAERNDNSNSRAARARAADEGVSPSSRQPRSHAAGL